MNIPPSVGSSATGFGYTATAHTLVPPFAIPPPGFAASNDAAPSAFAGVPAAEWTEHKAPDGRTYFYNHTRKQSSWEKPESLMTPAERLLAQFSWKEHTSNDGKVYYHNVNTKESLWEAPREYLELREKVRAEQAAAAAKAVAAMTSTRMAGIIPPIAFTNVLPAALPNLPKFPKASKVKSPEQTSSLSPSSEENSCSALDQAMAATLAAIAIPEKSNETNSPKKEEVKIVYKNKKEASEAFKMLLKEHNVPSNASWDQCVKIISKDSRYASFKTFNEKKQTFNLYKTQKVKDEREESRLRAKRAKEDLEKFLLSSEEISSQTKYYVCQELFSANKVWTAVPDQDRRDIYRDCILILKERERTEAHKLKKRNMKKLGELLEGMVSITYSTTWAEAQVMLLENSAFKNDVDLLGMDKEDALIVFEDHIRALEKEEESERDLQRNIEWRTMRKNRDEFLTLLDALHSEGKLTSMSLWMDLFPVISADIRFSAMLGQTGSTPLDLFKIYVENLKARFHDEKKIIKEILKDKKYVMHVGNIFDKFLAIINEDKRAENLDAGNIRLTFDTMLEKAESAEKERIKEELRRLRKLENEIKSEWLSANISTSETFEAAKKLVQHLEAFEIYEKESSLEKLWEDFIKESEEACLHHHGRSRKSKKNKKHKKTKARSSSPSDVENDLREDIKLKSRKSKSISRNTPAKRSLSPSDDSDHMSKKRRKHKHKKSLRGSSCESDRPRSPSVYPNHLDELDTNSMVPPKKKKKEKRAKKDKESSHKRHYHYDAHSTPLSPTESLRSARSPTGSDQALSESELVSKRAALLAALEQQMEE